MLPHHHLPQLTPNRINAAVNRLQERVWFDVQPLPVEASESRAEQLPLTEAARLKCEPVETCSFWGKLFDQRWCRVVLPRPADANTWLNWKDQGEATLYVQEKPYFGFNVAHRHCRLPSGTEEVWIQSSCIQSAIWHPDANGMDAKGSYFEGAFLCRRDDEAWGAYHDLKCLFDLSMDQRNRENPAVPTTLSGAGLQPPVDKFTPVYRRMLRLMDEAVDAVDTDGIPALRRKLAEAYRELRMDKTFMRCFLTGHAHLDLVWLWPERIGELKAVNIFATVNRLMDEYPEFRFAYSQPASYEAVKRREPALYDQVRSHIKAGQWEATGAMYVESDTLIACGEALARSFVLGQKGFAEIAGKPSKLTWLPDVFGYSACLPQIMKLTGAEYFFTTKMTWNAINRFPHSSFLWRGNDGSEVVAHVIQDAGYVSHLEIKDIKAPMLAHQQGDVHGEYLLPVGYGDGGGGPTHEMCERARRLGSLPGMPEMEWGQPEAFFDRLAKLRGQLPVHQGECYLEFHRGTFTTHGNLKETFRSLERALQVAEAVASMTGKTWDLESAWKRLVFAQFHDYIPGSSVWDVYQEGLPELKQIALDQTRLALEALQSGKHKEECIFNPHALEVRRWLPHPQTGKPIYISLPPLSGKPVEGAQIELPDGVYLKGNSVNNGLVKFRLNAAGFIDQLTWEGVEVPLSAPMSQLMLYPDKPANCEAWDIDRPALSLGEGCNGKPTVEPFQEEHQAGFRVSRKIGQTSEARVTYALQAGSPLVHISVELDWREPETLLKMVFPTKYGATHARFGIPYGSVLRPQIANGLVAEAMWEVPFSRHLEVFDEGEREGFFVVTEAKYGACVRDGEAGISLVRSPRVTGLDVHSFAWPPHLSRLPIPSIYSDIGKHKIQLAMGRYDLGLPRERQPAAVAETLFTPPVAYRGQEIA
jgi:alpha-mannosidase